MPKSRAELNKINEIFKGLELDRIEYNPNYEDYELHFKGGLYFCLGVRLSLNVRKITNYIKKEGDTPNE